MCTIATYCEGINITVMKQILYVSMFIKHNVVEKSNNNPWGCHNIFWHINHKQNNDMRNVRKVKFGCRQKSVRGVCKIYKKFCQWIGYLFCRENLNHLHS